MGRPNMLCYNSKWNIFCNSSSTKVLRLKKSIVTCKKLVTMYTISEVATKFKLSQKRIREYEKEGFIRPEREPKTNNRIFTDTEVKRIQRLKHLIHKKGFTIASLKQLLVMVPCWEIFDCREEGCEIYKSPNGPCWEYFVKKSGKLGDACYNCAVYLNASTQKIKLFDKEPRKCQ